MTAGHPTPVLRRRLPERSDALLVAAGGAAGAVSRWAVLATADTASAFPWPTLLVNIVGCLLIGALTTAPRTAMLWAGIGFAGGLTTFSTFAVETARLLDSSELGTGSAYVAASVAGGVLAVPLGRRVTSPPRSGRRSGTRRW